MRVFQGYDIFDCPTYLQLARCDVTSILRSVVPRPSIEKFSPNVTLFNFQLLVRAIFRKLSFVDGLPIS